MMKFEDLLMQPSDEKQKRILLEEEVEELREELDGQLQLKTVLQYALQRPNVGSCPCISTLPRRVQHLLEEVVMAEEEIAWLERKVDALKRKLYLEKELAEKWEVLPLKQVQHQQHQRLISKPLPPPRPDRSQNYQLRKQYRIRKDRRASVGSSIDFHTIYSPINLNEEEIVESSSRGSRNWRRHHSQPVDLETDNETPNKLSEEVLKCLISIYLKLNKASLENQSSSTISTSIAKQSQTCSKKSKSSFICSKTCTSSAAADAPIFALNDYASNLDPYGILLDTDGIQRDIGSYKNFIQVSRTSINTCHISECLPQMGKLRSMVQKFSNVDITCLTYKQKLAFWINVYNICIMHAFLQYGLPSTEEEQLSLVNKAAINVGGIVLNALAIEHFILRHPRDIEHGLTDDNERFLRNAYGLEYPEPNVTFSLCRGSWSSPALRIYTPDEVANELERAKMAYLEASVGVTSKKKIMVPKLMQWHMKDFADDMESLVEWMYSQLASCCSLKKSMMDCLGAGEKKSLSIAKMIEDNKATERRSKENPAINGAHIMEDDQNNSKKRKKVEQGSNQPKKKFKEKCFNYGKIGHKSTNCCTPKKGKKKDQANMLESNKECNDLCAMFSECNLMGNPREWWMDSGATLHVCSNKEFVSSFAPA
ncbi:Calcium-dependent lipid-binding family protein isoform 1 [Capsicum annuum]|nr:Calcium-dependent lipid-binding family protein isoform 1 [Capsicum annuum]